MKITTIGVYGMTEDEFFGKLVTARVDTFLDVRSRRGMRGSQYSFVNSQKLQSKLRDLGIVYAHLKELAPDQSIRDVQKQSDRDKGILKRERTYLSETFIQAYIDNRLHFLKADKLLQQFPTAQVFCLFCVEREPLACHRSIIASYLHDFLHVEVIHLI